MRGHDVWAMVEELSALTTKSKSTLATEPIVDLSLVEFIVDVTVSAYSLTFLVLSVEWWCIDYINSYTTRRKGRVIANYMASARHAVCQSLISKHITESEWRTSASGSARLTCLELKYPPCLCSIRTLSVCTQYHYYYCCIMSAGVTSKCSRVCLADERSVQANVRRNRVRESEAEPKANKRQTSVQSPGGKHRVHSSDRHAYSQSTTIVASTRDLIARITRSVDAVDKLVIRHDWLDTVSSSRVVS